MKESPVRVAQRYLSANPLPSRLLVHGEIGPDGDALKVTVSGMSRMGLPVRPFITNFSVDPWGGHYDLERLLNQSLKKKGIVAEDHFFHFSIDDSYENEALELGDGSNGLKKLVRYMKSYYG